MFDFRSLKLIVQACIAGMGIAGGWGSFAAYGGEVKQPNVILIMTDDQGYGEFSCHGNPIAQTPHIDALASESIRLTDFHVAPMCTPTRGQLMTGLDAFRNGAINVSSGRTLLRPELKTMADVFRSAGYRTGIFGKWHLGDNYPYRPQDRGFQEVVVHAGGGIGNTADYWGNNYFDDTYWTQTGYRTYQGYCTDIWFNEGLHFIERHRDRPFFCYIPTNAPHSPHLVAPRYSDPYLAVTPHAE
ncbi:MAG: sulfatase-like hydrolase/transferase, partial [Planctomycetaceae bacterium]|nr:sulfatase-like hydrolase/transferase [Planctomycetaceae bacterium]